MLLWPLVVCIGPVVILQTDPTTILACVAIFPALVWVALADLRSRTIPDAATAYLGTVGALLVWSTAVSPWWTIGLAVSSISTLGVLGEVIWRVRSVDVLGLGDVKLIGAGILIVGAEATWLMILLASVGGIVAALLATRRGEQGIPFGPFLAYAIFVTFLISGPPA
jgi:prepilin signal peptidase PulO-like enzyme (type II secretory pathway)